MNKKHDNKIAPLNAGQTMASASLWLRTATMATSMIVVASMVLFTVSIAHAQTSSDLRSEAEDLRAEVEANSEKAKELGGVADTLEKRIAQIETEVDHANTEIQYTEVRVDELTESLEAAEVELESRKELLKATLQALYERNGAGTLELLMATDSFTQFITEQEYLGQLQVAVKQATDEVVEIKTKIEEEKHEQEDLLTTQQQQKSVIVAREKEQAELLRQTQGEEQRYTELVSNQHAELKATEDALAAQLAAEAAAREAARKAAAEAAAREAARKAAAAKEKEGSGSGEKPVTETKTINLFTGPGAVSRGEVIGSIGSTGFSTGPHIHFRVDYNGSTVNPYAGGNQLINGYLWPVAGNNYGISQLYGCVGPPGWYAPCGSAGKSFHSALDIWAPTYTQVRAVADGEIIFRGCSSGLGYVVVVDHGSGWQTWYPHMVTPSGQVYGYC